MSFLSTVAFLFVRLVGLALIIQDFSFLSMIVDYVIVGFVNVNVSCCVKYQEV